MTPLGGVVKQTAKNSPSALKFPEHPFQFCTSPLRTVALGQGSCQACSPLRVLEHDWYSLPRP